MLRTGRDQGKNEADYGDNNNFSIPNKYQYDKGNGYQCAEKEIS